MRARYVMKGRREEAVAAVLDLISSYTHSYTVTQDQTEIIIMTINLKKELKLFITLEGKNKLSECPPFSF